MYLSQGYTSIGNNQTSRIIIGACAVTTLYVIWPIEIVQKVDCRDGLVVEDLYL